MKKQKLSNSTDAQRWELWKTYIGVERDALILELEGFPFEYDIK